jgi:hypothetical protein
MSLKNPVTPPGIDLGTVRLVGQRLNHYATPGPRINAYNIKMDLQEVGSGYRLIWLRTRVGGGFLVDSGMKGRVRYGAGN